MYYEFIELNKSPRIKQNIYSFSCSKFSTFVLLLNPILTPA